jgi:hypothetical protein
LLSGKEAIVLTFANQDWVDLAGSASTITAIFLDRPKARDLRPIGNLRLYNLTLSYPSYVREWGFLSLLSDTLLRLTLDNTLSLGSLDLLSELRVLEALRLSGGYSKDAKLPSLEALGELTNLKIIDLAAVRFANSDLSALWRLPHLARFDCPFYFPRGQVEKLKAHFSSLESNVLNPA